MERRLCQKRDPVKEGHRLLRRFLRKEKSIRLKRRERRGGRDLEKTKVNEQRNSSKRSAGKGNLTTGTSGDFRKGTENARKTILRLYRDVSSKRKEIS